MDFSDDLHQDSDISITLDQFKQFLVGVGRISKCPVCPHSGNWNFYVDNSSGLGGHSMMALTPMTSEYAQSSDDRYYLLAMDCPKCGYMSYTNSKTVLNWLAQKGLTNE